MSLPETSVVVVSRGRPEALRLCLLSLEQQSHPRFEIVVVADPAGLAAAGREGRIGRIAFDEANISAARNLGLAAAAGEVVAFIDDDAVAEPSWLARLTAPFADGRVAAAGGFVRGRNGLSWQWRAAEVDREGRRHPMEVPEAGEVRRAGAGRAVKTEGTNMAVRREVAAALGGFDPAYRFYLDETDLNLRLAAGGQATAIVPGAQVVHGFLPSALRRADRVPRDLTEIGASLAVLSRRHGADPAAIRLSARAEQRRRLLTHMVAGRIEPRNVARLMATLEVGWAEGMARALPPLAPLGPPEGPFRPFAPEPLFSGHDVISGRVWQAKALREEAARKVAAGRRVTLHLLWPGAARHRLKFTERGWWEQTGGLFGRSVPGDPVWRAWRFADRVVRETTRAQRLRDVDPLEHGCPKDHFS